MEETGVAMRVAKQAGEILRANWGRHHLRIERKGIIDLASEVDRQSEVLIAAELHKAFPSYGILSEEGSSFQETIPTRWIIDPLDGTTNFLHAYPLVAVSIGLVKDAKLVMGVVYNPILDELFVAEDGNGATLNGKPIQVSSATRLGDSVLASGFPYDAWTAKDNNTRQWGAFIQRCISLRCDGSAALDLCHVACGRLDGYWERGIFAWDMAAGSIIAREAGAWVGDYQGGDAFLEKGEVVAANPGLAKQIRQVIRENS